VVSWAHQIPHDFNETVTMKAGHSTIAREFKGHHVYPRTTRSLKRPPLSVWVVNVNRLCGQIFVPRLNRPSPSTPFLRLRTKPSRTSLLSRYPPADGGRHRQRQGPAARARGPRSRRSTCDWWMDPGRRSPRRRRMPRRGAAPCAVRPGKGGGEEVRGHPPPVAAAACASHPVPPQPSTQQSSRCFLWRRWVW